MSNENSQHNVKYFLQKIMTLCNADLSTLNLSITVPKVSSIVPWTFTQNDRLALSGDVAVTAGSFIPKIILLLVLTVAVAVNKAQRLTCFGIRLLISPSLPNSRRKHSPLNVWITATVKYNIEYVLTNTYHFVKQCASSTIKAT